MEINLGLIITTTISLAAYLVYLTARFSKIEVKVDTLWDFSIRRAISEGVNKGMVAMNSPVTLTDVGRSWYPEPLTNELRDFYKKTGHSFSSKELFIEIERRFGERIMKEVCIPHDVLYTGSCVLVAVKLAQEAA